MRRAAADRVFASRCARYERWMRRMCRRSALAISITSPRMVNFVSSTRRACQRRTVHWITIAPRASFDLRIASARARGESPRASKIDSPNAGSDAASVVRPSALPGGGAGEAASAAAAAASAPLNREVKTAPKIPLLLFSWVVTIAVDAGPAAPAAAPTEAVHRRAPAARRRRRRRRRRHWDGLSPRGGGSGGAAAAATIIAESGSEVATLRDEPRRKIRGVCSPAGAWPPRGERCGRSGPLAARRHQTFELFDLLRRGASLRGRAGATTRPRARSMRPTATPTRGRGSRNHLVLPRHRGERQWLFTVHRTLAIDAPCSTSQVTTARWPP